MSHKNKPPRFKYLFNATTLQYETVVESKTKHAFKTVAFVAAVVLVAGLYFWLYTSALGLDLPKTAILKRENARWVAKMDILSQQLDQQDRVLRGIEERDDDVYRSIYGLDEIPEEVKQAGFGGVNRYESLDRYGASPQLRSTVQRLDIMTKRAYLQTNALDEVAMVSKQAGEMVLCVPAVPPINPVKNTYRISSSFGYRSDPVFGRRAFHDGVDFATFLGNPVYSTGDGVIEKVRYQFFGYGNEVIVNHGYGYKTRYAHLNSIDVRVGQKVKRGEKIATVGNTGKSTGPHLHYEVIYKGKQINPSTFYDLAMGTDEYESMVRSNRKQD